VHVCCWRAANAFELFNHEASQSNYCAFLSAAGNQAEFMYSNFAAVEMLQFNSSQLVPIIVRYLPESQDNCDSGGMVFTAIMLRWLPHIDR
jgi:hypothetical protein